MSKILIQTSAGELVDKLTILEIKKEKIKDPKKLGVIEKEYLSLENSFKDKIKLNSQIQELRNKLKKINQELWNIEDDIRFAEKNNNFNEKFIELARSVYKCNDKRAKIKLEINILTKSDITEIKQYTEY